MHNFFIECFNIQFMLKNAIFHETGQHMHIILSLVLNYFFSWQRFEVSSLLQHSSALKMLFNKSLRYGMAFLY